MAQGDGLQNHYPWVRIPPPPVLSVAERPVLSIVERTVLSFYCPFTPNGLVLAAMARDKFRIENGNGEYVPLNFTMFRKESFKTFLLKSDLYEMRNTD